MHVNTCLTTVGCSVLVSAVVLAICVELILNVAVVCVAVASFNDAGMRSTSAARVRQMPA